MDQSATDRVAGRLMAVVLGGLERSGSDPAGVAATLIAALRQLPLEVG